MRYRRTLQVCTLSLVSLLFLPYSVFGEGHDHASLLPQPFGSAWAVRDVALLQNGVLKGRLVDQQGIPEVAVKVTVQDLDDAVVAKTVTENDGRFVLSGLKGGKYTIRYGQDEISARLWVKGISPPSATDSLLLVGSGITIRGQSFPGTIGLTRAAAASAAASAAVGKKALGIINAKPLTPADPPPAS